MRGSGAGVGTDGKGCGAPASGASTPALRHVLPRQSGQQRALTLTATDGQPCHFVISRCTSSLSAQPRTFSSGSPCP